VIDYLLMTVTMILVLWLMGRFNLLVLAKAAMDITSQANGVLLNSNLSDLEKEQHSQQMAKKLMAQLGRVLLAAAGVFLLPLLPLYLLSWFNLINLDQLFDTMMTLPALLWFTALGGLWWWLQSKMAGEQPNNATAGFDDNYSMVDKLLHQFAFNRTKMQLTMAKQESEQHEAALKSLTVKKPVFIAGLPRGGTTILLDVLSKTEAFSYHRYQDMPFMLTPLLWDKFSGLFIKKSVRDKGGAYKERAHQDGIKINLHSPEAFEEMLWKAHWPQAYQGSAIEPWSVDANPAFDTFFTEHIKKLQLRDKRQRYISKNNLNITRLPYLKRLFPDSLLLVPFREPVQHALSLLKQHRNFTAMHKDNAFSREYMAGVGHFDFGANLKPVNFNQWFTGAGFEGVEGVGGAVSEANTLSPDTLDFWLHYWVESYQYLLDNAPEDVLFVGFEQLCRAPEACFKVLAERLSVAPQSLAKSIGEIRIAKAHPLAGESDSASIDSHTLSKAEEIHRRLLGVAVNG
jgi:hypothetical protein